LDFEHPETARMAPRATIIRGYRMCAFAPCKVGDEIKGYETRAAGCHSWLPREHHARKILVIPAGVEPAFPT
jgi:hypothetical protein